MILQMLRRCPHLEAQAAAARLANVQRVFGINAQLHPVFYLQFSLDPIGDHALYVIPPIRRNIHRAGLAVVARDAALASELGDYRRDRQPVITEPVPKGFQAGNVVLDFFYDVHWFMGIPHPWHGGATMGLDWFSAMDPFA